MNRIITTLAPLMMAASLAACAVVPPLEPIERKPVAKAKEQDRVITMTLGQLLTRYAPASFEYNAQAPDVDFSRPVRFDSSLPWAAAFDKALSDAGIDRASLNEPPAELEEASVLTGAVTVPSAAQRADVMPQVSGVSPQANANVSPVVVTATVQAAAAQAQIGPVVPRCDAPTDTGSEPVLTWDAQSNASLKQTLDAWSRTAGWEVSWNYIDEQTNNATDLTLGGGKKCIGTYRQAVRTLIDSLPEGDHVHARMWAGNSPPLLRIYNKGKENQ